MDKTDIYYGNIYWLYEGMKIINEEFKVNFNKLRPTHNQDSFQFYECIIFNQEKEHSLYFSNDNILYEYFSDDRCELILKLLKIFVYKYSNSFNILNEIKNSTSRNRSVSNIFSNTNNTNNNSNINNLNSVKNKRDRNQNKQQSGQSKTSINLNSNKNSNKNTNTFNTLNSNNENNENTKTIEVFTSELQKKIISSKIKANIYLKYINGTTKWLYDYEVKRLLFNFIFLPNYTKIEMLRLFPLEITEEKLKSLNKIYAYADNEDNFQDELQQSYFNLTKNDKKYNNFSLKAKALFYDKYGLNLKKMDIEGAEIDNALYIIEVKELKFEKFDTKFIQLKSERLLRNFQSSYKYNNLRINKEVPNIKDFKSLFSTMLGSYNDLLDRNNVGDFLFIPPMDKTSDKVIKMLKPQMKKPFSNLLEEKVSVKEFAKNCSNKLFNDF